MLEAMALSWLMALEAAEVLNTKPAEFVAWHRFRRLATILGEARFSPFNVKAFQLLTALESEHDFRTALAHERMKLSATGVALHWHALEKGSWLERSERFTWIEALKTLHRLDKLQRDLASQLGQIKRHCLSVS